MRGVRTTLHNPPGCRLRIARNMSESVPWAFLWDLLGSTKCGVGVRDLHLRPTSFCSLNEPTGMASPWTVLPPSVECTHTHTPSTPSALVRRPNACDLPAHSMH